MRFKAWILLALCFALASGAVGLTACGGDDDDDNDDDDVVTPDDDDDDAVSPDDDAGDDDGEVRAVYEYLLIDTDAPPPNPVKNAATPDEYNKIPLFRFHAETDGKAAPPTRSIVIFSAGLAAGSNQMFHLARSLVELSRGRVEVWVPEKRHALLEDQFGMDLAEERNDPYIGYDYYWLGREVEGRTYQIPSPTGSDTDMMSEWGMDMWVHDIRRLVHMVPEEYRRTNVFLAGDSRGAGYMQVYAGYVFEDGSIGADEIAGLILWDGGFNAKNRPPFEFEYLNNLKALRNGTQRRYLDLQVRDFWFMEIFGMIATEGVGDPDDPYVGPDGFFYDYGSFGLLLPLLTRGHDVTVTNEAFFSMVLDSDHIPYPLFMGHLGCLGGGPVGHDFLGDYPAQDGATYHWTRYDECDPPELVDSRKLTRMLWEGPSNFSDFHHSQRMELDMTVAGDMETEGTWRDKYLPVHSSRMDAPVFTIVSRLYEKEGLMERYRGQIAPTRDGLVPREEDEDGFRLIYKTDWSHMDAIAVEKKFNPIFPVLLDWIDGWSAGEIPPGSVSF
ncbi:MAG: hypothetical protein M5R36_11595 [Deltaproteobacteria bacterium]|nr:hypothetical protein [Deltaproteobacteria bacterium]